MYLLYLYLIAKYIMSSIVSIQEPFKWCITGVQFFHPAKSFNVSFLVDRSADYSKTLNMHITVLSSDVNPSAHYFL
jgi:hypothetical protein